MRLVTFDHQHTRRIGAIKNNAIIDLHAADAAIPSAMRDFLCAGDDALTRAHVALEKGSHGIPISEVALRAPIYNPEKIVCIGLNYADHAAESNMPIPGEPVVFSKFASSIIGPGDDIHAPAVSKKVDYEVELVVVMGKAGRHISEADALSHVAGYTVGHDVSARDYQLEKPAGQWMMGKTFDTFAPIGPWIVTSDEISDPHTLGIRCLLNGQTVQSSNTNQLIFKIERLIAYLSHVFTFSPGDLIFTGTPSGVGMGRKPPLWLRHGDRVICQIDGIGQIENTIVAR